MAAGCGRELTMLSTTQRLAVAAIIDHADVPERTKRNARRVQELGSGHLEHLRMSDGIPTHLRTQLSVTAEREEGIGGTAPEAAPAVVDVKAELRSRILAAMVDRAGVPVVVDPANPLVTKSGEQPKWAGLWAVHVANATGDDRRAVAGELRSMERDGLVTSYAVPEPGIYRWYALADEKAQRACFAIRRELGRPGAFIGGGLAALRGES